MKPVWLSTLLCLLLTWTFLPAVYSRPTRAEFTKAMATIRSGMSEEQVIAALGRPDSIRADYPGDDPRFPPAIVWVYGTNDKSSFPTLGWIHWERGEIRWVTGGRGTPPDPAVFDEQELKATLRLINKAFEADPRSREYNPLSLIQAVNRLWTLGKDRALTVVDEYLRVRDVLDFASDGQGQDVNSGVNLPLFLVLRLLFDVPGDTGELLRIVLGGDPSPAAPKDAKLLPLFPLVLLDDVPFCLAEGPRNFDVHPSPTKEPVEYFRKNGTMRAHPLRPTNDPLSLRAKLLQPLQWLYGNDPKMDLYANFGAHGVAPLLALVHSVYRIQPVRSYLWFELEFDQKRWDKVIEEFDALHVKWDPARNDYVFGDGTSLPEINHPFKELNFWVVMPPDENAEWQMSALNGAATLFIERKDALHLCVIVYCAQIEGRSRPEAVLKLRCPGDNKQIAEFKIPASTGKITSREDVDDDSVELPEDKDVQAELTFDGKTTKSPVFVP